MSSASDQKLCYGVCSAFKSSFDEFVGEKEVFPSYSSAILAPLSLELIYLQAFLDEDFFNLFILSKTGFARRFNGKMRVTQVRI